MHISKAKHKNSSKSKFMTRPVSDVVINSRQILRKVPYIQFEPSESRDISSVTRTCVSHHSRFHIFIDLILILSPRGLSGGDYYRYERNNLTVPVMDHLFPPFYFRTLIGRMKHGVRATRQIFRRYVLARSLLAGMKYYFSHPVKSKVSEADSLTYKNKGIVCL